MISSTDFCLRHVIKSFDVVVLQFMFEPNLKADLATSSAGFIPQSVVVVPL